MEHIGIKVGVVLVITVILGHRSRAGVTFPDGETFRRQRDALRHDSPSSSYLRFHGPVEGPVFEVNVPYATDHEGRSNDLQGHEAPEHGYALDFVAHPKYEFSYGVADHETGDFHDQQEIREGSSVSGRYSVKEPGGGVRVVSYRADEDGFRAVVHTSGKNDHTDGLYGGQGQFRVREHRVAKQQERDDHDHVPSYATNEE